MSRNWRIRATAAASLVVMALAALAAFGGDYLLERLTVGSGGETVGPTYTLRFTLGEWDAGVMSGPTFTFYGGYWGAPEMPYMVPGDCDVDGDVDIGDAACFVGCLTGPEITFMPGCQSADFEADTDVDLVDFAILQRQFGYGT